MDLQPRRSSSQIRAVMLGAGSLVLFGVIGWLAYKAEHPGCFVDLPQPTCPQPCDGNFINVSSCVANQTQIQRLVAPPRSVSITLTGEPIRDCRAGRVCWTAGWGVYSEFEGSRWVVYFSVRMAMVVDAKIEVFPTYYKARKPPRFCLTRRQKEVFCETGKCILNNCVHAKLRFGKIRSFSDGPHVFTIEGGRVIEGRIVISAPIGHKFDL